MGLLKGGESKTYRDIAEGLFVLMEFVFWNWIILNPCGMIWENEKQSLIYTPNQEFESIPDV
jgi:hypothetical protein